MKQQEEEGSKKSKTTKFTKKKKFVNNTRIEEKQVSEENLKNKQRIQKEKPHGEGHQTLRIFNRRELDNIPKRDNFQRHNPRSNLPNESKSEKPLKSS